MSDLKPISRRERRPRGPAGSVAATDNAARPAPVDRRTLVAVFERLRAANPEPEGELEHVNPFTLPGGYHVTWTGMRVEKHDGSQHHLVGTLPTVPVEPTVAAIREGRDEYLEAALKIIH